LAVNVNWTFRPHGNAIGESLDIGDVQPQVAEIKRRLNINVVTREKKKPAKGANREHREDESDQAQPDRAIFQKWISGGAADGSACGRRRHEKKGGKCSGGSSHQREKRNAWIQAAGNLASNTAATVEIAT
jgi:hypothetical protein